MSWFRRSKPVGYKDTGENRTRVETVTRIKTLTGVVPQYRDSLTSPIPHDWFFAKSTQKALRTHFWNLPRYSTNAFDCENFAQALVQWVCIEAAKVRLNTSPEVWVICVKSEFPFAGIADGYHALSMIETDKGTFVLEPQSIKDGMTFVPYSEYPNKPYEIYQ